MAVKEMQRKQFTFYESYFLAFKKMPRNHVVALFFALCEYALYGREPKALGPVPEAMFDLIRPTLDSGRAKAAGRSWEDPASAFSEARREKGRQKGKEKENENENEKEIEIEIEKEKETEKETETETERETAPEDNEKAAAGEGSGGGVEREWKQDALLSAAGEDVALRDALQEFAAMRAEGGHRLTPSNRRMLAQRLCQFPAGERLAVVQQSVRNGWKDLYPLKKTQERQQQFQRHGEPLSPLMLRAIRENMAQMGEPLPEDGS